MDPKVVMIVLNWNRASDTIECVRSLEHLAYSNVEIVIVDNASIDGSGKVLEATFPRLKVMRNSENLGYAEGNNVGIRYALERDAAYVLLLNNDTVVDKALVSDLVEAMERDPRVGVVAPTIYDYSEPSKIWFAGASIDWSTGQSPHIGLGEHDRGQCAGVLDVDRVTGCAMLVKRAVFERIGLLDPDFFLYYEDVDFCVRAGRAGYRIACVRSAKVWHKESSSTGARDLSDLHLYYETRNRLIFLSKHIGIGIHGHIMNLLRVGQLALMILSRPFNFAIRRRCMIKLVAMFDFYKGNFGIKKSVHSVR